MNEKTSKEVSYRQRYKCNFLIAQRWFWDAELSNFAKTIYRFVAVLKNNNHRSKWTGRKKTKRIESTYAKLVKRRSINLSRVVNRFGTIRKIDLSVRIVKRFIVSAARNKSRFSHWSRILWSTDLYKTATGSSYFSKVQYLTRKPTMIIHTHRKHRDLLFLLIISKCFCRWSINTVWQAAVCRDKGTVLHEAASVSIVVPSLCWVI